MHPSRILAIAAAAGLALFGVWAATQTSEDASAGVERDGTVERTPTASVPVLADADEDDDPARLAQPSDETAAASVLSPEEGIQGLLDYGRALGPELDFVKPWPDPAQLEALRSLTLRSGVSTAALQDAASRLGPNDVGRVALVAACAWAAEPSETTDGWLRDVAADWSELTVPGEQAALAAVLALDLGERQGALELAAEELLELSGGDEDSPSFAGLASVRTWHALRGIADVDDARWRGRFDRWFDQDTPDRRVNEELWALAARSSEDMRDLARAEADAIAKGPIDQRVSAVVGALSSPSMTRGERGVPGTMTVAQSTRTGWIAGAAVKAIVASDADEAAPFIRARLRGDAIARDQCLEGLRTWRLPKDPAPVLRRLAELQPSLGDDADAKRALARGLDRAVDRLRFHRGTVRKESAAAALDAAAALQPEGSEFALRLSSWAQKLRASE